MTLPYPPTANLYWRMWRGRIVKSAAARAYQANVKKAAFAAGAVAPLLGPVVLEIAVFRPRKLGDLDNCLKVSLDSLRGIAFEDDRQVVEIHALRFDDAEAPRLEIRIRGPWVKT